MRWIAWSLMALCAVTVGCEEPVVETIPTVVAEPSSGTTVDEMGAEGPTGGEEAEGEAEAEEGTATEESAETSEEATESVGEESAAEASEEGAEAAEGADETKEPEAPATDASASKDSAVRFVADKKISVPGMMCPYSCWPAVKATLAKVPGVEGVQLADQPEGTPEGSIETRVVELKLGENFDVDAAVAALKAASYDAEEMN